MNWLIREKMFTYFYDKFRPVSRMHYTKCGVNCSLLPQFWMLQKVCATLDHCFITTHSIHKEGDILQIYFVWYSVKPGTTPSPTSLLAHFYSVPFLINSTIFETKLLNIKCVFWLIYDFFCETLTILRRILSWMYVQGGARNVIPLIVQITHFYYYKNIWHLVQN